ncbi:MAG: DNA polymerase III subunit gamma/tau [Brachymonas sp.]|nr:DNA polymerase III subunit gamma/tau [Brachymonas sp.]
MSYLVLARKYRPRHFGEMVGQEHVVQALTNALTQQRLHHAYLFTGTRGVGKTTVSRILAKSLNCTGADGNGGITATPCGQCPACTEIDAGRFVDYTELDAASNRGVDEVQGLLEQAVYKPVQGRFKVFMIDEVHMLTNTAFNAMLKTLEEPPEYLKFVLATTDPQKVPVTVLSRCLQFNLRPMAPETVFAHLQQVLQAEGINAEPAALHLLARAARGSMRDALSLTDQAIAFGSGKVDEALVRQMLGSVDSTMVFQLIEALAAGNGKAVVELSDQLRVAGLSAATTLEDMARVLQRMAVHQAVPGMAVNETDPDAQQTAHLATLMPADETQLLYSLCIHGRAELGLAPDEYAGLTMVLLRLLPFKQTGKEAGAETGAEKKTLKTAPPEQVKAAAQAVPTPVQAQQVVPAPSVQKVPETVVQEKPPEQASSVPPWEDLPNGAPSAAQAQIKQAAAEIAVAAPDTALALPVREQPEPGPAFRAQPASTPQPASSPKTAPRLVPTEAGQIWFDLAQQICAQGVLNGFARELLLQAQLMHQQVADSVPPDAGPVRWLLRVENETLNHEPNRKRLEQAIAAIHGQPVRLQVEYGRVVDCPALRLAADRMQQQQANFEAFTAHPFVQAMMRDYGARIAPGSITSSRPADCGDAQEPN